MGRTFSGFSTRHLFSIMQEDGIVIKKNNSLTINQSMKKTLRIFVNFLKAKGEL